jgi:hypothetical protein
MKAITRRLVIVASLLGFTVAATPALALCKYGTPHCVNPHPGPKLPKARTAGLPDQPPGNEDCVYYGNCNAGTPEGTGPDGLPIGGLGDEHHGR